MRRPAALALVCALAAAGCTPLPPKPREAPPAVAGRPGSKAPAATPAPTRAPSDVDNLLAFYQQMRALSPAEIERAHEAARIAYETARSDFNRVRYALMLMLPDTPFHDEARALNVLEPVVRTGSPSLQGFARLLVTHLHERRRLAASIQDLQQKLDALKSLERAMIERKR